MSTRVFLFKETLTVVDFLVTNRAVKTQNVNLVHFSLPKTISTVIDT